MPWVIPRHSLLLRPSGAFIASACMIFTFEFVFEVGFLVCSYFLNFNIMLAYIFHAVKKKIGASFIFLRGARKASPFFVLRRFFYYATENPLECQSYPLL